MIEKIMRDEEFAKKMLGEILNNIHVNGPVSQADFEKLAYIKLFHKEMFATKESELMYLMGLFYKTTPPESFIEVIYSIFATSIEEETGEKFTPVQAEAYRTIKEKTFFSFSAPTSAGKSYLFRELITTAEKDVVIVVPSRALIAEYLKTVKDLVGNDVLVLQFIENINTSKVKRRVFVVTPERGGEIFKYKDTFDIELFLFDEAQLSEEEKVRGMRFDAFVRRTSREFPNATKVFAHPFVANPEAQLKKHGFVENSAYSTYRQNAVGKIFLSMNDGELTYFSPFDEEGTSKKVDNDIAKAILERNGTILIYASKDKLYKGDYEQEYLQYLRYCPKLTDARALRYVEMLRDYIGAGEAGSNKESVMIRLMERGIVIHHGSIPLKGRLIIEDFVRANHAKICFATSTLLQGINMPFDAVFIDNFYKMQPLNLKNLIGRAGRTTNRENVFDFGYVIVHKKNIKTFCDRMKASYELEEVSKLDDENSVGEDLIDLVEAVKNDTFDEETNLALSQVKRLEESDAELAVSSILDSLFAAGELITGNQYYELEDAKRTKIKDDFKAIFISHMRRKEIKEAEKSILSAAIPILLWRVQGKSFKEVIALRFSYLTRQEERRELKRKLNNALIDAREMEAEIGKMTVRYSARPSSLPNGEAARISSFPKGMKIKELQYDQVVFDTYDYIDEVINFSLSDPLCAAFLLYYNKTNDSRAKKMSNYIRFGTDDQKEIWLLKYGFSFEEIEWIKGYVDDVSEREIVFSDKINELNEEQMAIISRYI